MPGLRHCFVICRDDSKNTKYSIETLFGFSYEVAERLSNEIYNNKHSFMLIHSGRTLRKRDGWHLHVFVINRRWQKAWVYMILSIKNIALIFLPKACKNWMSLTKLNYEISSKA